MVLSDWQIAEIAAYASGCCDPSGPVLGDVVDHLCCLVEAAMDDGALFDQAMALATGAMQPDEIRETETDTLKLLDMKPKNTFWRAFRWWMPLIPLLITIAALFFTRNLPRRYSSSSAVIVNSDFGLKLANVEAMIHSQQLLKKVSLRLYARCMVNGDVDKDNNFIKARNFRTLLAITPPKVEELIDKSTEYPGGEMLSTWKLQEYEKPEVDNFVYGLFNYHHHHYSYSAINQIRTWSDPGTDIIYMEYTSDDPGIAYNTLQLVQEELIAHYTKKIATIETPGIYILMGLGQAYPNGETGVIVQQVNEFSAALFPVKALPSDRKIIVLGWLWGSVALMLAVWGFLAWRKTRKQADI